MVDRLEDSEDKVEILEAVDREDLLEVDRATNVDNELDEELREEADDELGIASVIIFKFPTTTSPLGYMASVKVNLTYL
jgi:hypothetical protein